MLCRAGLTPVANVDQATGERAGKVVRSRRKSPRSPSFAKFGSLPSLMYRSTSPGSRPSSPRKINLRILACLYPSRPVMARQIIRTGHVSSDTSESNSPPKTARKDPRNANPARTDVGKGNGAVMRAVNGKNRNNQVEDGEKHSSEFHRSHSSTANVSLQLQPKIACTESSIRKPVKLNERT